MGEGPRSEQPAGAGGLSGAGAAADEYVAALAEREPGTVVPGGGHRLVLDVRGPGALVDDLALRADPPLFAGGELGSGLPQPAAVEFVTAQLLAGTEIREAPAPADRRRHDPWRAERDENGQHRPDAEQDRRQEQQQTDGGDRVQIPDRQGAVAAQPPCAAGAAGREHDRHGQ